MRRPPAPRRHTGSQGGFTLITVLAVVLFFSLVLGALLGLITADVTTTSRLAGATSMRRAADSALQVALTRLKTATTATLASEGSCAGVDGMQMTIEGRSTTVRCEELPSDEPLIGSPGAGGPVITLLRNYDGFLDGDLAPALANGPGFFHSGGQPLGIAGDVKVRQSGVGWTNPPTGSPSHVIDVNGSYRQGDVGLSCSGPFQASDGATCAAGRDAVVSANGPAVTPPKAWAEAAIKEPKLPTADLPACGGAGSVVTINPGIYTYTQVATLNAWFGPGNCDNVTFYFPPGDYHFDASGWYQDTVRVLGADIPVQFENVVVFNDASSTFVFGTPNGWDPAAGRATIAAFPEACDRTAPGVSITLSPRTAIRHKGGLVAMCGDVDGAGTPKPVIYSQVVGAAQKWAAVPTAASAIPAANGFQPAVHSPTANVVKSTTPAPAGFPALGGNYDTSEGATAKQGTASCAGVYDCTVGTRFKGFVELAELAPAGTLKTAVLKLRGSVPAATDWARSYTMVRIAWGDGSNRACSITTDALTNQPLLPGVPTSLNSVYTVDLLKYCHNIPYDLNDARQLQQATIDVYETIRPTCYFFWCPVASASLDYAWIETETDDAARPSTSAMGTVVDVSKNWGMYVFGSVHVPRTEIEVQWAGTANHTPIFVGGVVAKALASSAWDNTREVGVVAANVLLPPIRRVRLTAEVDGDPISTASVEITDTDTDPPDADTGALDPTTYQHTAHPGWWLEVTDWAFCRRSNPSPGC